MMTADTLQELANDSMEDKDAISNLTSTNMTLSQSFTQEQDEILVLSKKLQTL